MPKRQAKHTVIVVRQGKRVSVHPGQPFDFTDEEIEHIQKAHGEKSVSKVTREVDDEDETQVEEHNTGGQNLIDETGDTEGETSGKNATATATQKPVAKKAVPAKKTGASGL